MKPDEYDFFRNIDKLDRSIPLTKRQKYLIVKLVKLGWIRNLKYTEIGQDIIDNMDNWSEDVDRIVEVVWRCPVFSNVNMLPTLGYIKHIPFSNEYLLYTKDGIKSGRIMQFTKDCVAYTSRYYTYSLQILKNLNELKESLGDTDILHTRLEIWNKCSISCFCKRKGIGV